MEEEVTEQVMSEGSEDEGPKDVADIDFGDLGDVDLDVSADKEIGESEGEEEEDEIPSGEILEENIYEEEDELYGEYMGEEEIMAYEGEVEDIIGEEQEISDKNKYYRRSTLASHKSEDADSSGFKLETYEESIAGVSSVSSESEPTPLDRSAYYDSYLQTVQTYSVVKRLNNFLHKKMAEYFKKRKMEHVFRETTDHLEEAEFKYGRKLDSFYQLIEKDKKQRDAISEELGDLKKIREEQVEAARQKFDEMISHEREVGTGLISAKTGKEIPEKFLEKMIQNQINKAKELEQLRLSHIKIRNAVAEKHAEIKSLDKIGDHYTLIEYEQLKIENQGHADKIEERDEELAILRRKCSAAIQCLAHIREKCSATETNIKLMKEKLDEQEDKKTEVREAMNQLKQERDFHRRETQRLKDENGLMTKDKLLIDMENAIVESENLKELIKEMEEKYDRKMEKLMVLKENYEKEKKKQRWQNDPPTSGSKHTMLDVTEKPEIAYYKARPTIIFPKFEGSINKL